MAPRLLRTLICLPALVSLRAVPALAKSPSKLARRSMSTSHRLVVEKWAGHHASSTLILEPSSGKATGTVFIMHGLGDSAEGWIDTAAELSSEFPYVKFILPTAPVRPITINGGMSSNGWYDITTLGGDRSIEKAAGIEESCTRIEGFMAREIEAGVPASRILLAGFSQGAAMSLYTGLNYPGTLAGIAAMSGYIPNPGGITAPPAALETPVLILHGTADAVVPLLAGVDALERVKAMGAKHTRMETFRGLQHSVNMAELRMLKAFLKARLPAEVEADVGVGGGAGAAVAEERSPASIWGF